MTPHGAAAPGFRTITCSSSCLCLFHLSQTPLRGALSLSIILISREKQVSEALQGEKAGF